MKSPNGTEANAFRATLLLLMHYSGYPLSPVPS